MRIRSAALAAGLVPALLVAGPALAADGGTPISTPMTGAEEAPGPGDPDATGVADFRLNQGQGEICFDISWSDVDGTVNAAHIHLAPAGSPGPVVVPLFTGPLAGDDAVSDCVDVDPELVKAIRKDPAAYYVNVHSLPSFGPGAIRGQLG
jgi:hypothetical protein